ncbi:MAG: helix-turn-helix domain-containing protein [Streptosporangiales bacterium]|nr:helix-turn-helix domain-containing protein [Streptosporangiales bacterium]
MAGATGDRDEPGARRQRLAAELRRARELAGISGRDLAQRIGISQSKVSRIEAAGAIPSLPEVTAWAEAVRASAKTRELLTVMTEAAFTEVHTHRAAMRSRAHVQDEVQELEARARVVRTFQPSVVPGLLQTAEYARRVFAFAELSYTEGGRTAAVAARLQRQTVLYEEDRRFDFLISEAALWWRPGPVKLLLAQLDRIASLSTLDNVSIGFVPYDRQAAVCPLHGFVIYGGHDGQEGDLDTFVTVEMVHAYLTVNDPHDVRLYQKQWSRLCQTAIFGEEAREFLAALGADLRTTAE